MTSLSADTLTWQKVHAFLVDFIYSCLPYVAVEQSRKPPSTMTAGTISFKWDMMPPKPVGSNCISTIYVAASIGFAEITRMNSGQSPQKSRRVGLIGAESPWYNPVRKSH